jgi:hypothetical protein
MQDQKALALFEEILTRTKEGRIPWEPSVSDVTLLAAIKGKYSLVLKPYTHLDSFGNEEGWPSLVMRDSADRDLINITAVLEGIRPDALQDLYETARRQALKVDEKVQDLLTDLRNL